MNRPYSAPRATAPRPFEALTLTAFAALAFAGCATDSATVDLDAPEVAAALASIGAGTVEEHIRVLAHDSLEGRAPGTAGYAGAARYVEERLQALGLQPAGVDGTFRQPVPLRRATVVESESAMIVETPEATTRLTYDVDYYLGADPLRESVEVVDVPVIFVGFGVSAPMLGYDDYADADVEGKSSSTSAAPRPPSPATSARTTRREQRSRPRRSREGPSGP